MDYQDLQILEKKFQLSGWKIQKKNKDIEVAYL